MLNDVKAQKNYINKIYKNLTIYDFEIQLLYTILSINYFLNCQILKDKSLQLKYKLSVQITFLFLQYLTFNKLINIDYKNLQILCSNILCGV